MLCIRQLMQFVEWCLQQEVSHVVMGECRRCSTKYKKEKKEGEQIRKLSNWSFGKLYSLLEYKLKAKGITIEKVDESYTSQTCPVCGNRKKSKGRNLPLSNAVMRNIVIFTVQETF